MTAQPRPLEGKIRFATQNPWDDPLFRSAIRGEDRAKRRAEMQATIDRADAQRVGKQCREEAAPAPKRAPELPRDPTRPQFLAEPWVCPGCRTPFETANGVITHKTKCVGLYEQRRDREAVAAAVAKGDALLADPKTVVVANFNEPEPPPVACEPIQADTPVEAPACPIGEAPPTVAAEEGEKEMAKVETKKAPTKGPRPCGCARTGLHKATCALAPKAAATPVTCECGKPFSSEAARNGHRRTCDGRPKAATPALAPIPLATAAQAEQSIEEIERAAGGRRAQRDPEPPSLRCLVVRVRGAVPLEVECATVEDAAAFVRLVGAGGAA